VRRHVRRIAELCAHLPEVLRGLIREDDLSLLDGGWVKHNGAVRAFAPQTPALGVVMPSNSPGVNTLWLPAIVMKVAVALKPGRDDPWTPYRLFQALLAAGLPADALSYYPTDHEGAMAILRSAGRSLLFGDDETTAPWRGDSRVEIHGPGRSKVLIGEDLLDAAGTLEVCISSILENSGRSCTNASTIVVPRRGAEIAEALAARLATVEPRPPEDEEAKLAAFVRPEIAERISAVAAGWYGRTAEPTSCRRSSAATPSPIRWPTGSSSSPLPASWRSRRWRWPRRSVPPWWSPL